MQGIFNNCVNLTSLDLSSFYTSNTNNMDNLFYNCHSLTSLDLSNFDTHNIKSMKEMYYNCKNLKYLNISNFDTSSVENMESMFSSCNSLTSIDISSFNTSKVKTFYSMFYDCNELIILNISNFNTPSLTNISKMFSNSQKLEYINFQKYNETNILSVDGILDGLPENIVICLDKNNEIDKFKFELNKKLCPSIYCFNDWKEKQKKIIYENSTGADNFNNSKYENNGTYYSDCPKGADFSIPEIEIYSLEYLFDNISNINNEDVYQKIINDILQEYTFSKGKKIIIKGENNFVYQITTTKNDKNTFN